MSYFYVQTCHNGHHSISNRKLKPGTVCKICGLPLIDRCPACGQYIRKWTLYGATPILPGRKDYELPDTCPACDADFPWAKRC